MVPTERHTVYIRCRGPELWAALTEGQLSRHYYFDSLVDSTFERGAAIRYLIEDHDAPDQPKAVAVEGVILDVEPGRSLAYTFRFTDLDEPETTVRWTIGPHDAPGILRVDVEHEGITQGEAWNRTQSAWPLLLSGLKTWLETGEPLARAGAESTADADDADADREHDREHDGDAEHDRDAETDHGDRHRAGGNDGIE